MPQKSIALGSYKVSNEIVSNKSCFNRGEILFGKLRPYFHKVGIAPVNGVCSTDILVLVPKTSELFSLVLGHVASARLIEHVTAGSTGTKMPRTNWKDIGGYKIAIPDIGLAAELTKYTSASVRKILSNIEENRTLTELRDTLLPKLISGQIHVPEAEKLVEETA